MRWECPASAVFYWYISHYFNKENTAAIYIMLSNMIRLTSLIVLTANALSYFPWQNLALALCEIIITVYIILWCTEQFGYNCYCYDIYC